MKLSFKLPIVLFSVVLSLTLGSTIFFSAVVLQLEASIVQELALILSGTGILTTLVSFWLYRVGTLNWLNSIQWALGIMVVFTVGVILINLWVLSQLMFVSSVYLSVISSVLVFGGLTALSFGYFIARAMTDRLAQLSEGAQRLARGELYTRLAVFGNDEIAELTQSFNQMAQDLQAVDEEKAKLEETRRNLIAWVSHDLRTPLASMRVMMEALADGIIPDEETKSRYIERSLGEIAHLSRLIDDLFELAQADVKDIVIEAYFTSLHDLISDTVSARQAKAEQKNLSFVLLLHAHCDTMKIAPDKIQRVLTNLIDNAIKYTPSGETITIETSSTPQATLTSISNSGVWLSAEQLERAFESFYRGEASRTQQDNERGTGLGLAIAKRFIEAHGGTIEACNTKEGTKFAFTLPCGGVR